MATSTQNLIAEFNIISGKYKAPMARGMVNTNFTLHQRLERYLSSDVDNWLGNLSAFVFLFKSPEFKFILQLL